MNRYECLLFDADNTLFDFDTAQQSSLEKAVQDFSISFDPVWLTTYSTISRKYWEKFEQGQISSDQLKRKRFEDFVAALDLDVSPDCLNASYLAHLANCTMLISGCEDVLKRVSEAGIRMAIVTNGLSMIQRSRFHLASITRYFDEIVISDEIGFAKPDPRVFEYATRSIGIDDKSKTLMIGDNLKSDIKGAHDFGIDSCWFNPNQIPNSLKIQPDFEIQCLDQILEFAI